MFYSFILTLPFFQIAAFNQAYCLIFYNRSYYFGRKTCYYFVDLWFIFVLCVIKIKIQPDTTQHPPQLDHISYVNNTVHGQASMNNKEASCDS